MNKLALTVLVVVVAGFVLSDSAEAGQFFKQTFSGRRAQRQSRYSTWHGNYAHTAWGSPVALVVPPTVEKTTNWGWGVSNARVTRIPHQFGTQYPGEYYDDGHYYNTPAWPSDTTQFGVYYGRAPW